MELVRGFSKLSKSDVAIAGGKGASLGEMINAGIPVPDGYVVLSGAFDRFIEETKLNVEIDAILDSVKHEEIHTVENASEKIQALILSKKMPKDLESEIFREFKKLGAEYVAVRSSATSEDSASAAWAGQLDSYLNTTEKTLIENVKNCWASLFTPRAIFYRYEKNLHGTEISVAVVVQKMVNSEESGIAFSVHPVTQDYNQLIIEAGFGLGEAIVQGSITPDSYVVDKQDWKIIDISVNEQDRGLFRKAGGDNEWRNLGDKGKQQVLSENEIIELSKLIVKIEKHYGFPCDIEWAKENGKFYIVQSRPITTLTKRDSVEKQKIEKIFSRDFSLIALQMDYLPESSLTRPWADGENPFSPYLAFWRNEGTSKIYFNIQGIEWIKKQLIDQVRKDENFLKKVEKNVREGIKYIRPIYEKKKVLGKKDLIRFVNEFISAYHWIEAMWWIKSMAEEELKDIDCSNIVKLRKETEELSAATDIVIRKSLAALYPKLGNLSAMINREELSGKEKIDKNALKKRDEGFVLINNQIILDKSFKEIIEENNLLLEEQVIDHNVKILKGEKVSFGKYKGKVVRVMGHNDFGKVNAGDVLVSPMTMVDFLPVMKKAGAFITDEGGALCHAAIVARELGKPCVVGTGSATEVLKDGDEVEVDADNGIVRVLEKSESKFDNLLVKYLESIKENPIEKQEGHMSTAIMGSVCDIVQRKNLSKYYDMDFGDLLLLQLGRNGVIYFSLDKYRQCSWLTFKKLLKIKSPQELEEYKDYQKTRKKILDLYENKKVPKKLEELKDYVNQLFDLELNLLATTLFCESMDHDIANEMAKSINVKDIESFIKNSTQPAFESFMIWQDELFSKNKHDRWLFADYYGAPTEEEAKALFKKKISEKSIADLRKELAEKKRAVLENKKKLNKFRSTLKGNELKLLDYIQLCMELRDKRKDPLQKLIVLMTDALTALASRYDLSYHDVSFVHRDELEKLGEKSFLEEIKKRQDLGVLQLSSEGGSEVISAPFNEVKVKINKVISSSSEGLKGIIAQPGNVRGIAKIIAGEKDFHLFNKGDILVTSMTRPEFVPLMKKAAAVITDEGGVTCHAAIISRELGIPCIIGTRTATMTLKNGDLVEVDAYNGTIMILDNKKSDYVFFYESQGYNFILEDIIMNHYCTWPIKVLALGNSVRKFVPESTIGKLHSKGLTFTEKEINHNLKEIQNIASKLRKVSLKGEISNDKIREIFTQLAELTKLYSIFDTSYSEGIYKVNPNDSRAKLIERSKNVIRDDLDFIFFRENGTLDSLLRAISRKTKVSANDLKWYRESEIKDLLDNKKKLTQNEVDSRKKAYVLDQDENDKISFVVGDKAEAIIKNFEIMQEAEKNNSISGTIANGKGKIVRGKVRVIHRDYSDHKRLIEDMNDMKDGEILVTTTTDPEFMPALKKASAVLTDIGGMLSHAAISSRELNIPCLVGTKNATKILKNGDMVEFDANTGTVRVLKNESRIKADKYLFHENVPGGYPMDIAYINLLHIMAPQHRLNSGIPAGSMILVFKDKGYDLYIEEKPRKEAGEEIMTYLLESDERIRSWEMKLGAWIKELKGHGERYSTIDYTKMSKEKLVKTLRDIMSIERKNGVEVADMAAINYGTEILTAKLNGVLKDLGYDATVSSTLLTATGAFPLLEYENAVAKLALECYKKKIIKLDEGILRKNSELKRKTDRMLEEYGWLDASIIAPPKSLSTLIADVNDLLSFGDKLEGIIKEREKEKKNKSEKRSSLLRDLNKKANAEQRRLIHFGATSSELGRLVVDAIMKFIYERRRIYPEIAKRLGITEVQVKLMLAEEIEGCLLENKKPDITEIEKRMELCVCYLHDNRIDLISGEEAEEIKNSLDALRKSDNKPMKGEIAFSRGKVTGIARHILDVSEIYKLQKGEILISSRTYPDLLPAMKKAGAIIAELGGLLSHAAIVSRELHIPCIVGVRNAMSKIPDGALIEVDTDSGVVRILEKEGEINQNIDPKEYLFLENVPGGYPLDITYINLAHITAPSLRKEFGISSAGSCIMVFENKGYNLYFEKEKWFKAGKRVLEYNLESDQRVNDWELRIKKWVGEFKKTNKYYKNLKVNSLSDKSLFNELDGLINFLQKCQIEHADITSPNYATNFAFKELETILTDLGFNSNRDAPILLRSTGEFLLMEYEKELGNISLFLQKNNISQLTLSEINKNKKIKEKIEDLLDVYGWLDASIIYPPKQIENVILDINSLLSFNKELPNILKKREEEKQEKKIEKLALLKEINSKANQAQKRALRFVVESAEIGRILVDEVMQFLFNVRKIYPEIAKRLGISEWEVRFLLKEEIKAYLIDKKEVDLNEINERKKLCICFAENGNAKIFSGPLAVKLKQDLDALRSKDTSPLKGEIAFSKGKVKGIARLVKDVSEMGKVNKGDILVSSRTYPDLLPAMKKAGAIIAELGGLLSHAAIVSREMGIPCLVGVRNATSKIKDGDEIEVDTEKGMIKVLKSDGKK